MRLEDLISQLQKLHEGHSDCEVEFRYEAYFRDGLEPRAYWDETLSNVDISHHGGTITFKLMQ